MNKTKIEYLDSSWNPIAMRCTPVSEGCTHCWHLRMANRLAGNPQFSDEVRAAYTGERPPVLVRSQLNDPLKRKKPSRLGVQFMGDLFHKDVPEEYIFKIWRIMWEARQHTFLILSKRPGRMLDFTKRLAMDTRNGKPHLFPSPPYPSLQFIAPNVWLGVTAENQKTVDERIPILLQIPAVTRFVSCEPLLERINLGRFLISCENCGNRGSTTYAPSLCHNVCPKDSEGPSLSQVICGGEFGPGARSMDPAWARDLRDQCQIAGVPFFFKQGSAANWNDYKNFESFPSDLQVREYPITDVAIDFRQEKK